MVVGWLWLWWELRKQLGWRPRRKQKRLQCPAGVAPWTTVQPDECTYKTRHNDRWARAAARTMEGAAGLPVGVQVLTRPFEDETCVAALRVLEQARQGPQGGGPV